MYGNLVYNYYAVCTELHATRGEMQRLSSEVQSLQSELDRMKSCNEQEMQERKLELMQELHSLALEVEQVTQQVIHRPKPSRPDQADNNVQQIVS